MTIDDVDAKFIDSSATYLFAASGLDQRAHLPMWDAMQAERPDSCIEVLVQDVRFVEMRTAGGTRRISLSDLAALGETLPDGKLYIDISGLAHHVWAPLVKAAMARVQELCVLYVEPAQYRPHPSPASATLFDLSEGFRGLEPLPSFANLAGPQREADAIFVPFLGFEGTRARYLALTLDPLPTVIPVIGLPGFRAEYPQISVVSNDDFLQETKAGREIRFARASCPFEAYSALEEIQRDHPGAFLYLAPIGTKPHALGAILFAIDHPTDTEVMYDHPIRKSSRTTGVARAHVYRLKPRDADL